MLKTCILLVSFVGAALILLGSCIEVFAPGNVQFQKVTILALISGGVAGLVGLIGVCGAPNARSLRRTMSGLTFLSLLSVLAAFYVSAKRDQAWEIWQEAALRDAERRSASR